MLCKHSFRRWMRTILANIEYVCWLEEVYFARVDAKVTSQTCPNCGTHTGKKAPADA